MSDHPGDFRRDPDSRDLDSPDAAARRAAIIALAKRSDPAALPTLERTSRSDPDLDLRVLAVKAIRHIEQQRAAEPPPPDPAPDPLPDQDTGARRNRELGRFYLDAATNYHMTRDRPRTLENLAKALHHDGDLAHDRYVENLVEQVLDLPYADAIALLRDDARLSTYIERIGGKARLRRRQDHSTDAHKATPEAVVLVLGVLLVIGVVGAALVLFLGLPPVQEILDQFTYNITAQASERVAIIRDTPTATLAGASLLFGTGYVVLLLPFCALVHAVAVYALAGEGTLRYLIWRVARLDSASLVIAAGSFLLLMLLPDPALRMGALSLVAVVEIVLYVGLLSALVNDVYDDFQGMTGCHALFAVGLMLLLVGIALGLVLTRVG